MSQMENQNENLQIPNALVSLCVIALNEEKNIGRLFENILAQDYDHSKIEVVLVDSCSTDTTKTMMSEFAENTQGFYGIKVLDNVGKIQPTGWNVAISNSVGDLIIRVDAHAIIPSDFVRENVECIMSIKNV